MLKTFSFTLWGETHTFNTLAAAKAAAHDIFRTQGVIVGIDTK